MASRKLNVPLSLPALPTEQALGAAGLLPPRAERYELGGEIFFLPDTSLRRVCGTRDRWRALDVFVDLTGATFTGVTSIFSVGVYAVSNGIRTLVGTGRSRLAGSSLPLAYRVQRICSVRVPIAERFEVVASYNDVPATAAERVNLSYVASDDGLPVPEDDDAGLCSVTADAGQISTSLNSAGLGVGAELPASLDSFTAISAAAAVRFVHVHNVNVGMAARAPQLVYGLPANGSSVAEVLRRARNLIRGEWAVVASSSAATSTIVADVHFGGLWR